MGFVIFTAKDFEKMHADMVCRSRWLEFILGVTDRIGITSSVYSRIPTEALDLVTWQETVE